MVKLTPLERINWIAEQDDTVKAKPYLMKLTERYDHFLEVTNEPEKILIGKFIDADMKRKLTLEAYDFAETMFDVISNIGDGTRLHRVIMV